MRTFLNKKCPWLRKRLFKMVILLCKTLHQAIQTLELCQIQPRLFRILIRNSVRGNLLQNTSSQKKSFLSEEE
ncbi:hypothetical protein F4804DRAFT_186714 [Jackrogersella minutella]|nr:hypothetical protein F4804DRAFT_186714 [Jackrogersella minutella]